MSPHFVYWWHVPSHNQIKVGYGYNPRERMTEYAERYGFQVDPSSLQYREMRSERAAKFAEEKLHNVLPDYDLIVLDWGAKVGRGTSRELFDMGESSYESVAWLVGELLAEIIRTMPTDPELIAAEMAEQARWKEEFERREEAWKVRADDDIPF